MSDEKTVVDATHPDHPDFVHPGTPRHPKYITLRRYDAPNPTKVNQSVVVHPEAQSGLSTAPLAGDTAGHAMEAGMVPTGYALKSPKTGQLLRGDDDLYDHVDNNSVVEVVKE